MPSSSQTIINEQFRIYISILDKLTYKENKLIINGNEVQVIYASEPTSIDYTEYGIKDALLVDNTGVWRDEEGLSQHLNCNGIKKVLLTAPGKGGIKNIVHGINNYVMDSNDTILGAASCTTNAIVPVLKVLDEEYGIDSGHIESVHSYTNDQNLIDNFHKKERRGRSAALNIVITETGAGKAVGQVLPNLLGKLTANAVRVPTPNVSLIELVFCTKKEMSKETINDAFTIASKKQSKKVLEVTLEKLVSIDFNHNSASAIVDLSLTNVVGKNMGKISAWYDNEWGFSNRMCDIAEHLHQIS